MQSIERIVIEFIPQEQQRYDTCGDWFYEGTTLVLKVSKMAKQTWQQAVALHELFEALACNARGVTQEQVDAFDMGPGKDLDEPGESPLAPYQFEHQCASVAERLFIAAIGESWSLYDKSVGDHGCEF